MQQSINRPLFNLATLFLRLALAVVMFPHGAQKMLGWFGGNGISGTLGFFGSLGIPEPLGMAIIIIEFFAPILLVLGFFTRISALAILCIQAAAAFTIHLPNGFFMNWSGTQKGEGIEFFILSIACSLALVLVGAGAWAIDGLVARGFANRRARRHRADFSTQPRDVRGGLPT